MKIPALTAAKPLVLEVFPRVSPLELAIEAVVY